MSGRRILASGAVIAWEARGLKTQAFLNRASRNGFLIALPAIVIAETTWGGARAAAMNCVITLVTAVIARKAGELLAAAGNRNATVDALIVAEAVLGGAFTLLTSDVDDLSAHANGYPRVRVYGI